MRERLQKILAAAGVASRRGAEVLIAGGTVTVNGRVAQVGESADPECDVIAVDGRMVRPGGEDRVYLALNKPRGYVTTARSTHRERTVLELVDVPQRVFPAGRLDKDSSGLLLLTNDGAWANLVTHPRYQIEKEYTALVQGVPGSEEIRRLQSGVLLPDGTVTARARIRRMGDDRGNARLSIAVIEGKKRQIRLMCAAVGHPVIDLRRVRIGPIVLGRLGEASWRYLDAQEVESIREYAREQAGEGGA